MATIKVLGTRRRHGRGRTYKKVTTQCTRRPAQPHEINPVGVEQAPTNTVTTERQFALNVVAAAQAAVAVMAANPPTGQIPSEVNADLALPIEELNLTIRPYNALKREGIDTVGALVACTEQHLLVDVRGLGRKFVDEIKDKLRSMGLALKEALISHHFAA